MSPLLSRSSKNETPELGTIYDLNAPLCKHLISNNIQTISNEDTPNVEQEKLEDHMYVHIYLQYSNPLLVVIGTLKLMWIFRLENFSMIIKNTMNLYLAKQMAI